MTTQIGFLLYPGLTQLDLTGPYEVLHRLRGAKPHLLWKEAGRVQADSGLGLYADTAFADCPPLDVLVVPGGNGQLALMQDEVVLSFLRAQGEQARYLVAVCTGSLLFGAAGLLDGYRAATHWAFMDLLPLFGAIPVEERVVQDRNRFTGGGVTAGIDVALRFAAELDGPEAARDIELILEYNPAPPFRCGHPRLADPEQLARVQQRFAALREPRAEAAAQAASAIR